MKTITTIFAFLMAFTASFAQCGYDTLGTGSSGVGYADTSEISIGITPHCTPCPTEGCVAWELPYTFNGHFFLTSPVNSPVSIQVTTGCTNVVFDTCVSLPPPGAAGQAYVLEFAVFEDAQLLVCGDVGQEIHIYNKSLPIPQEELSDPLYSLDSCDVQMNVFPRFVPRETFFELGTYNTIRQVDHLEPSRRYMIKR